MPLHLIKLSVGTDSLDDLASWQKKRLKDLKSKGRKPELIHITRQTPKKADEILAGGSIYWVVKGGIIARQTILDLRPVKKDGVPHCGIVYDPKLVPVRWRPKKAFQGWRYLEAKEAPPDRKPGETIDEMPEDMRRELAALGLL